MRSSRPDYLHFDPECYRIISLHADDRKRVEEKRAVRTWTFVGVLFVACLIIERYL